MSQPGLRTNANGLFAPGLGNGLTGFFYEHVAQPLPTHGLARQHPPNAGFVKFDASGKAPGISHQSARLPRHQMQGLRVGAINVLKNALLLHHKHLAARRQQRLQLRHMQVGKRAQLPGCGLSDVGGGGGGHGQKNQPGLTALSTKPTRGK